MLRAVGKTSRTSVSGGRISFSRMFVFLDKEPGLVGDTPQGNIAFEQFYAEVILILLRKEAKTSNAAPAPEK